MDKIQVYLNSIIESQAKEIARLQKELNSGRNNNAEMKEKDEIIERKDKIIKKQWDIIAALKERKEEVCS